MKTKIGSKFKYESEIGKRNGLKILKWSNDGEFLTAIPSE